MNKFLVVTAALAGGLVLSSCRSDVDIEYGRDGRWHRDHEHNRRVEMHDQNNDEQTRDLMTDYQIKYSSASEIVSIVKGSDPRPALAKANLKVKDVAPLLSLNMPSRKSVRAVAAALHEDEGTIQDIMQDYIFDMKSETAPAVR